MPTDQTAVLRRILTELRAIRLRGRQTLAARPARKKRG